MILQHTTAELNTGRLTQRQIQKNADWTKVTNIVTPLHLKSAPTSSIIVSQTVKDITITGWSLRQEFSRKVVKPA